MKHDNLEKHLKNIKDMIEYSIINRKIKSTSGKNIKKDYPNGQEAKKALIRSQIPIFELHEFVKEEFIKNGISSEEIFPPLTKRKPEIKLNGYFKSKDQDVCVIPQKILSNKVPQKINWGVMATENKFSEYGSKNGEIQESRILATNVRSQLSSLEKNSDTLFERMIAESFNLHKQYPNLVLGELYLIPLYEYDDKYMKNNEVCFKKKHTNVEKYITFFSALNNYECNPNDLFRYNYAALIIADFSQEYPKIYKTSSELKQENVLSNSYNIELKDLSPYNYVPKLINDYKKIFKVIP